MPRRRPKPVPVAALPEHLVTHPAQMAACLDHLAAAPVLGFDTEFVGEDAYRPELCLVQVATSEQLFIIDPFAAGPLDDFWKLLLDPDRVTVTHAGREDIRMCFFQAGRPPADVFDVQLAAGLVGLPYPIGYGGLVNELLGQRMSKGETLTDWRRRPLLPAQVRYAFDDVRFLLPAWKKLTDKLKRLKRTAWAAEEFATFARKAVADDEPGAERWRRVKGIGGLDRRGLAVAREVYAWRDRFAERVNRPAKHLLRDDVLAEIARRGPTRPEDLAAFRGVPQKEIEPILEAVRKAKALPPDLWPEPEARDTDPPNVVLLGNLLGVVLADWCGRNKLAPNLVASGARGWRAQVVLPGLEAILDGAAAVRVADPAAAAPLEVVPVVPGPGPGATPAANPGPPVETPADTL
jgi:ribonuclease D